MKTLVYQSGALGDFLSILPLLRTWKENTRSQITLLGKSQYGVLAQMAALIDEIYDIDKKDSLVFFSEAEPQKTKEILSSYTHCMLFAKTDSSLVITIRKYFSGTILIQDPFPPTGIHIIDYHFQLIKNFVFSPSRSPIFPPIELYKKKKSFTTAIIVIHPGSGSQKKNWAFSNYLQVAQRLRNKGLTIIWITGPADTYFSFPALDTVYNNRSLSDLVSLLSQSDLYIGNDSGISHLAAASGCAVIALFGPSDPVQWSPRGLKKITVVYKKLPCSPCHLLPVSHADNCSFECLSQISSNEVVLLAEEQLEDRCQNDEGGRKH
jgi:ADP-heptose:LPS heptosyltransferase